MAELVAAIGIGNRFEVGAALPLALTWEGDALRRLRPRHGTGAHGGGFRRSSRRGQGASWSASAAIGRFAQRFGGRHLADRRRDRLPRRADRDGPCPRAARIPARREAARGRHGRRSLARRVAIPRHPRRARGVSTARRVEVRPPARARRARRSDRPLRLEVRRHQPGGIRRWHALLPAVDGEAAHGRGFRPQPRARQSGGAGVLGRRLGAGQP